MTDIMRITPLKAFSDNYIWVLHDTRHAIVVDPGDAGPVLDFLARQALQLQAVWITHGHHDHTGGIAALRAAQPAIPIFGPAGVPGVTEAVMEGSRLMTMGGYDCHVYETPGHTANHLVFHCGAHLFCGDTLFAGGCGRVFDGSMAQLHASLQRLAALPDDTLCYPAHEYTLANLQFARALEPDSPTLATRWQHEQARRAHDEPTLPCRLADERRDNPFLRSAEPAMLAAARRHDPDCAATPLDVFTSLREWKNTFRPS